MTEGMRFLREEAFVSKAPSRTHPKTGWGMIGWL